MSPRLDFSLPAGAPELGKYGEYDWSEASFAVYSLVDLSDPQLEKVVDALTKESIDEGMEPGLARLAKPTPHFNGKTLKEIVQAHITMVESGADLENESGPTVKWYPPAFVVVVKEDWESDGGLLFVLADDEKKRCPMDKFFFKSDVAWLLLSGLLLGNEWLSDVKDSFCMENRR
ncbi:hypothetical protein F4805DRAFT_476217 [Annulohypoxylon moriforme]|nr:hypothetical protein F4805DRAFT_476217 [Annulohypoxylon moriforme]